MITKQELIGYSLSKQIPDMQRGFAISTNYGDLFISAEDAGPFADLAKQLLEEQLADLMGGAEHGR